MFLHQTLQCKDGFDLVYAMCMEVGTFNGFARNDELDDADLYSTLDGSNPIGVPPVILHKVLRCNDAFDLVDAMEMSIGESHGFAMRMTMRLQLHKIQVLAEFF